MRKVIDIDLASEITVKELVTKFETSGGFSAKKLAEAIELLRTMFLDKECIKFLSFPANLVATGCRGVLKELVKRKLIDVIITTCGTLDHDLARCWRNYYHGDFLVNDKELYKKNIHRLGNIFIPFESYGKLLEEKLQKILKDIWLSKKELTTKELVWEIGKRIKQKSSIVYWSSRNKIPMFIPGIVDGAVGTQLWLFWQTHKDFRIDLFRDQQELCDIVLNAKRLGALLVGGGISKHHTLWWSQFKGGLEYAIYITTAVEWDGSLSGARTREAISWGKLKANAKHITLEGDASLLLPLMIAGVLENF
jgi:deoxyhypusine synthase